MLGVPALLLAIDAIPDLDAFSWNRLTSPDDGTLALQVITIACWIAWAILTYQLIASIVAQIRGLRVPRLPGLVAPQLASDRLVAAAALLFIAVPTTTAFLPQPKAEAAITATPLPDRAPSPATPAATRHTVSTKPEPTTERYTVKRGDSLWKIAEDRLGDGTRYVELVDLNEAVLDGHADFLMPGTVLRVPVSEPTPQTEYVVEPGDTLSEIAADELGDPVTARSIFVASHGTVQPDGAHLTDPDLIRPGWKLTIPREAAPAEPVQPKHSEPRNGSVPAKPPATSATPKPRDDAADTARRSRSTHGGDDTGAPGWLLPGLGGAGAVLGTAFWIVLRSQRRTQLRHRRPGRIVAPPPPELRQAEKTAFVTASSAAPRIVELDTALKSLAPPPRIVTVTLTDKQIAVTLATAAELAAPWTGADVDWRIAMADVPQQKDAFPPYPLLASIGQDDDGAYVFLNLEELRTVTVTGDADRKAAFARHLAAELAVNPWADVTHVDVLGLGSDLASFRLGRVSTHADGDTGFLDTLTRHLGETDPHIEPDDYYAAIIATSERPHDELERLSGHLEGFTGRTAAALVDLGGTPRPHSNHLHLTRNGRLTSDRLRLDLNAAGLGAEEARACALLLDITLDEHTVRIPRSQDSSAVSDLGGALVDELTELRPQGPAGDASLLPLDAYVYADAAATTIEDLEALAPLASPAAETRVAADDPTLDQDVARWESPTLSSTKLMLLGPVGARTTGDAKTTAARRPYYVELLAYLVLHPEGSTADDLAQAFSITRDRARVSMSHLRRWLGTDPYSGQPYLPDAQQTHTSGTLGAYKVQGVLCDLDLFRRLRARGQSRGADGIDDLIAALRLVTGEPFSKLRDDHWSWLFDGERWDHIMTSAIVDVGHIVAAYALANDDSALALCAARTAYSASPYDEVAQLDMIQAVAAGGDNEQAKRDLADKVFNRRDDEQPPLELPERTKQVVREKGWGTRRQASNRTKSS
jgi:nucleoid-associated protein YgaU